MTNNSHSNKKTAHSLSQMAESTLDACWKHMMTNEDVRHEKINSVVHVLALTCTYHGTHYMGRFWLQERTWFTKNKLEKHCQEWLAKDRTHLGRNWNSSGSSWLCCYKGRQCTSQHLLSNRGPLNFGYGFGERGFGQVSAIAISERWFQYATVDRQPYCLGCHRSGSGFVIWLLSCCPSASGHALNMLVGLYSQILTESVLILFAVCIGWNSWGQQLVVQSNYH